MPTQAERRFSFSLFCSLFFPPPLFDPRRLLLHLLAAPATMHITAQLSGHPFSRRSPIYSLKKTKKGQTHRLLRHPCLSPSSCRPCHSFASLLLLTMRPIGWRRQRGARPQQRRRGRRRQQPERDRAGSAEAPSCRVRSSTRTKGAEQRDAGEGQGRARIQRRGTEEEGRLEPEATVTLLEERQRIAQLSGASSIGRRTFRVY